MQEPTLLGEILAELMENIRKAYEYQRNKLYEKAKPARMAL